MLQLRIVKSYHEVARGPSIVHANSLRPVDLGPAHGHVTAPHEPAHCCSMHVITASTMGHVIRFSHDMQHVLAQSWVRPSPVHWDWRQISAGAQLNIDSHD
jgi:hypothetical protein